jgi:hypothetical protein
MKRPEDIPNPITAEEQQEIDQQIQEIEQLFERGSDDLNVGTTNTRVRDEVARICESAGWDVEVKGSMVIVRRPRRR